jgi:hypothetical protein
MAVIAIDFDGTLCEDKFPAIGEPRIEVINFVKEVIKAGHKTILWTCRAGLPLVEAVEWCDKQGITFDKINDNLEETKEKWGGNVRKVYADLYIDDKSVHPLKVGEWNLEGIIAGTKDPSTH